MLTNSHTSGAPVAGCAVPTAARLRDWFRRAALCQASSPAAQAARLRGANVALLHPPGAGRRRTLLHKTIDRLGAKAVSIEFNESARAGDMEGVSAIARVLGRLYDAVDCAGMEPSIVQSIAQESGVPVFFDLGCERHPVRALGELWTIEQALDKAPARRRIRFIGNPKVEPACAFVTAANRLGFGIELDEQGAEQTAAPFTLDASDPCRWKLCKGAAPMDQALRLNNRICLIQALLLQEIARG